MWKKEVSKSGKKWEYLLKITELSIITETLINYIFVSVEHFPIFIGMKTECSKCNQPLDSTRIGKQRYCKACHAEHMRATRPRHSELNELQKKKANARSYLNTYLRRGKIHKTNCQICGWLDVEAHHPDYDKPLEVIWYCRQCHLDQHNN